MLLKLTLNSRLLPLPPEQLEQKCLASQGPSEQPRQQTSSSSSSARCCSPGISASFSSCPGDGRSQTYMGLDSLQEGEEAHTCLFLCVSS